MVITKSISRFARNTVTLLETIRDLKALGIDVFFEEQNIHTLSADGELMLSILASYAQEESLSASENQKCVCVRISRRASLGTGRSSATTTVKASTSSSRTRPKLSGAFSRSSYPTKESSQSPMALPAGWVGHGVRAASEASSRTAQKPLNAGRIGHGPKAGHRR